MDNSWLLLAPPLTSVVTQRMPRRCATTNCRWKGCAQGIASLSLRDFTDDLVRFVNSLDSPLLVGHAECSSVESPFEREMTVARLEAETIVTVAAVDRLRLAIRNYHDSGNFGSLVTPLAMLSAFLDRLRRFEAAAAIAGFRAISYPWGRSRSFPPPSPTSARCSAISPTNRSPGMARR